LLEEFEVSWKIYNMGFDDIAPKSGR